MARAAISCIRGWGNRLHTRRPPPVSALALAWLLVVPAGSLAAQAVIPPPAVPTQARPLGAEEDLPDGLAEGSQNNCAS